MYAHGLRADEKRVRWISRFDRPRDNTPSTSRSRLVSPNRASPSAWCFGGNGVPARKAVRGQPGRRASAATSAAMGSAPMRPAELSLLAARAAADRWPAMA